jgi:hypothetical protein
MPEIFFIPLRPGVLRVKEQILPIPIFFQRRHPYFSVSMQLFANFL